MPRGRPKKTAVEVLPPEEINQPQVREVKHKTEWIEVRPVEEAPEDAETGEIEEIEIEERPKRKVNNERDELRKKLAKNGVTPGSQLKLTIERYMHSDAVDGQGGMFAETEHCTKYVTSEPHITGEDYLDVARKFGPGLYRFTLRMKNQIVTAWDKRIGSGASVIQHANPADPNSPQVIVNMPEGAQQPIGIVDPMKQMRELAKTYKELKQAFEPEGAQPATQARSEEEVLSNAILNRPEVIDNVVGSVMKRFGGKSGGDSDPWADVAMEAVKNGQAAQIVRELVNGVFNGFTSFFPKGANNGTPQMAQAPLPNQTQAGHQQPGNLVSGQEVGQMAPANGAVGNMAGSLPTNSPAPSVMPEDPYTQMLTSVIATLAANGPVEDAVRRVDGFLLLYPAYNETIDAQFSQPAESLLGAISTIPGCEEIAKAEHAKSWIENFQAKFFAESEGEE